MTNVNSIVAFYSFSWRQNRTANAIYAPEVDGSRRGKPRDLVKGAQSRSKKNIATDKRHTAARIGRPVTPIHLVESSCMTMHGLAEYNGVQDRNSGSRTWQQYYPTLVTVSRHDCIRSEYTHYASWRQNSTGHQ